MRQSNYAQPFPGLQMLSHSSQGYAAQFGALQLRSAFQPIYSLPHRRVVGHESLMRAFREDGSAVTPRDVFTQLSSDGDVLALDQICQSLHLHNFSAASIDNGWLFLNLSTAAVNRWRDYAPVLNNLLARTELPPQRVVLEILEGEIPDLGLLVDAVAHYKAMGCLVALDDFGAGHSDIERLWRVSPHIVKLDRRVVAAAAGGGTARRVLPALVELVHQAGSLALVEGIETEAEALSVLETEADLIQGFFLAHPQSSLVLPLGTERRLDALRDQNRFHQQKLRDRVAQYGDALLGTAMRIADGVALAEACEALLGMPQTDRCYLIDESGTQVGSSCLAQPQRARQADVFAPLERADNADWGRRPYFTRAINRPAELQVSRPYLSVANGQYCVTLSVALLYQERQWVLCCDIDWEDLQD